MLGSQFCCWGNESEDEFSPVEPKPFSLPAPIPEWPQGQGFATGRICLGEIEVAQVTKFERIWSYKVSWKKSKDISFYTPVDIPDGFFSLGHYCQPDDQQFHAHVLIAREVASLSRNSKSYEVASESPALSKPLGYTLVWSSSSRNHGHGYIWRPNAPSGYRSMGFVITNDADGPELKEIRCVRADLTESCETSELLFSADMLHVWSTRPCERGMFGKGVSVGTFFCSSLSWAYFFASFSSLDDYDVACLKNLDSALNAMPNIDQINALIKHYGPTVYFHPDEEYLPSSVSWFFRNGALLYKDGKDDGIAIDPKGSNLPRDGENDGKYWLDLALADGERDYLMRGNMESSELYVHVKPALGGSFTDIAMWIFCPFNGPATIKAPLMSNISLNRVGEHVGDWEHFTLRISNFTGELWSVYFSEHSGGEWLDASDIEFIKDNKPIVYSSKHGHASYPHAGCYLQGASKLGIGARNDCAKSKYYIDSSTQYKIIAAEYLGDEVVTEPNWLQYMREWGPKIVYDARSEADKIISHLPFLVRFTVESLLELFPTELYGEEGPTGPKEKDNWLGDERC